MVLAVFDFDGTLFPKDTLPFLLGQWRAQKLSRRRLFVMYFAVGGMYVRYKLKLFGSLSREDMRKKAMQRFTRIFSGFTQTQIDGFFEHCAGLIIKQLRPSVVSELRKAQKQGLHTVLLSGGYARLMHFVGSAMGFDTMIGTELVFKDGVVDGSAPLDIVCGDQKAERLRGVFTGKPVDWSQSRALADSLSDMSILELVGQPIAVNPDEGLKAILLQKGWPVLET